MPSSIPETGPPDFSRKMQPGALLNDMLKEQSTVLHRQWAYKLFLYAYLIASMTVVISMEAWKC